MIAAWWDATFTVPTIVVYLALVVPWLALWAWLIVTKWYPFVDRKTGEHLARKIAEIRERDDAS